MSSQNGHAPAERDSDDAEATAPRHNLHALAPQVAPLSTPRTHASASQQHFHLGTRSGIGGDNIREELWTQQYRGERSIYDALGYTIEPRYEHFRARYERTDEAKALVDKLPKKAWATPTISDPGATDETSEFEEAVEQFLGSDSGRFAETPLEPLESTAALEDLGPALARGDVIDVCQRASRMERLGEFSLIFLGLNDDNMAEGAVENLAEPVDVESLDGLDDLTYIEAYDEGRAHDDPFDILDDATDPRFNTPEYYNVDLGHGERSARIHYSRVVHVVDNVFEDDLRSNSVLEQSLNRLDDIEKIQGASAEAYWRTAYQGIHVSPPTTNGQMGSFADGGDKLHEQIQKYYANFQRAIFTGAEIDTLDVSTEDPQSHLETKYRSLAAGHDLPQSILMGNETGERATEEDRSMWHERVAEYRETFCEARVLRPLINRLIYYGILPAPQGDTYEVVWPELDEPSEADEADVAQTKANALNTATAGNPTLAATVGEIREELFGWKPELGSEAEEPANGAARMQAADDIDEMLGVEGDLSVPDLAPARANDTQYSEGDAVDTPDGTGVVVAVATEPIEAEDVEDVDASEASPTYMVVVEDPDVKSGFYKASDLSATEIETELSDPTSAVDRENAAETVRLMADAARTNDWSPPKSWRKSETPTRLIALDAFSSMSGSFDGCVREMRGSVPSPERFCGGFLDYVIGNPYWRGDSPLPGD